ncbi:MAG TPA: heme o synthase [Pirellulales bacterium]|jgi:protoheme IX farnesyltransferase|nr:heme o synthase [Pirellulales bacterium]
MTRAIVLDQSGRGGLGVARSRCADCLALIRPRIALLVLFTVAAAFILASDGAPDPVRLLHVLLGTALLVAGASALNQVFERHSDAMMERTSDRPLPGGRLQPGTVFIVGTALSIAGLAYLAFMLRQPAAIAAAAFALASYVFLYTPLKRTTTLNTLVGAVAGAMPPVIGWTAATNSFGPATAILFVILFLWQVPHFLAIAWIYRDDYARAGLRMLPVRDPSGNETAQHMVGYSAALVAVSFLPAPPGSAGALYLLAAAILGTWFLRCAFGFFHTRSVDQARRVLWASVIYLPALLTALFVGRVL